MAGIPEKDAISGQTTTGHEWDGIKELNTPLPGWWVWVFYLTIVWSIGYVIVYPAIPLGSTNTTGVFGWNARAALQDELQEAAAMHAPMVSKIDGMDVAAILDDSAVRPYAIRAGEVIFKENCAPCHQTGGAGAYGFPTLADDEWLWGGEPEAIFTTIQYGIRDQDYAETRFNEMPAFDYLSTDEVDAVVAYIVGASSGNAPSGEGEQVFVDNCAVCHNSESSGPVPDGNHAMGAPALNNRIWLYSAAGADMTAEQIKSQVLAPQHGVMPGWSGRLTDAQIKEAAVYVHSLGGGQ